MDVVSFQAPEAGAPEKSAVTGNIDSAGFHVSEQKPSASSSEIEGDRSLLPKEAGDLCMAYEPPLRAAAPPDVSSRWPSDHR